MIHHPHSVRYHRRVALVFAVAVLCVSFEPSPALAQSRVTSLAKRLTMLPMDHLNVAFGRGGEEMEAVVYKPHTYDPKQSYPLLVVLDADPLLGLLKTINFLWIEEGKAQPAILVGLPFGASAADMWTNRSYYLLPHAVGVIEYYDAKVPVNNGGGASELAALLKNKLLPQVLARYSIDQHRIGLAGFSMGGLFVAWHLVMHPGVFTDYVIISPPLASPFVGGEFENATASLQREGFRRPTRLFVSYGENDLEQVRSGAARWIQTWKALDDANLRFRSEVIEGLRHDASAIPALIDAYGFLYEK